MGGVASGCCESRGSSDHKDQKVDHGNDTSVEQMSLQAVAMNQPEGTAEPLYCQTTVCEKAIIQLNLHPSMTVLFQKECGSTQLVKFTERPVGLNFGPVAHWSREVKKVAPGSHAEEAGVKKGWAILTINGESLVGVDDETIHKKFGDAVAVLSFPKHMIDRRSSWDDLASSMASTRSPSESSLPVL